MEFDHQIGDKEANITFYSIFEHMLLPWKMNKSEWDFLSVAMLLIGTLLKSSMSDGLEPKERLRLMTRIFPLLLLV